MREYRPRCAPCWIYATRLCFFISLIVDKLQTFAKQQREAGSNGLLYRSVRHTGIECIAAFKPKAVTIPSQGRHFRYVWRGKQQRITDYFVVSERRVSKDIT